MTEKQPEALRLADALEQGQFLTTAAGDPIANAACALRRQHARIKELEAQIVKESGIAANEKLRADQMTKRHKMQCDIRKAQATEMELLRDRIARIGLDIDSALRGVVNESSPVGTLRLREIAGRTKPAQCLQQSAALQQAHRLGFLRAAGWAQRDDLFADVDSPTYKRDRAEDLGRIRPPQQSEPVPLTDEQICDMARQRCNIDFSEEVEIVAVINIARVVEEHHGITHKTEGSQP